MRRMAAVLSVVVISAVGLAACNGGDDEAQTEPITTSSTTATPDDGTSGATTGGTVTTTTVAATTTTIDTSNLPTIPRYEIVARTPATGGDIVVVELDPTSYDALTDIDLQNVLADVVETHPPILEAFVVDDPVAATLVLETDLTDEQRELLAEHHFVRLEEGFRMVFVGPFASVGEVILGS